VIPIATDKYMDTALPGPYTGTTGRRVRYIYYRLSAIFRCL